MTFGANASGGHYVHNHGFVLKYNEYFGTANNIKLQYTDRDKGTNHWENPVKTGSQSSASHPSITGSSLSNTDEYRTYGATDTNLTTDLIPYQTAYFWRRTA